MKTRIFIPAILLLLICSSCLKKDIMVDEADNVSKAIICKIDNKSYLILLEIVFQATSKSSEGGINYVSGYNESRVSVYSMIDGKLLARKKLGKQNEKEATELLGVTDKHIWFFSKDKKLGLYALNALSLEPEMIQEEILANNPDLKDKLADPEWYQINQFFGFDELKNLLILTDVEGYRYKLNPKTLVAAKVSESIKIPDFPYRYLATSVDFRTHTLQPSGEIRKTLRFNNKEINPGLSFIDPQFIQQVNRKKLYETLLTENNQLRDLSDSITTEIDSLKKLGPLPYSSTAYRYIRESENRRDGLKRQMDDLVRDMALLEKGDNLHHFPPQMNDKETFYLVHRSNTNKNALMIISAVSMPNDQEMKEKWQTSMPGIFYNPSDARETDEFKKVFSKGDPDFGFHYVELCQEKLVIIYMLHALCVDVNTGALLWKFRI